MNGWLCIIENAAPLKSARLRGFGGAACVLGEMCEGAGALARVLENEGCVPGRCIALSRRCVGALYRIVNCGPAKCCVWPVLAPAEGIVRAGGWSAGQSKSVAAFFVRIMTGVRFYWNVLRSIHACHAFLLECFSFDHACCLPPVRQTGRLAICCVPIPPWGEIAIRAFSNRRFDYQFSPPVHFRPERFFMAIPTEYEGAESAAQDRFCVNISALPCFPRGVRWGKMRKPYCGLPGLSSFDSRRGCVSCGEGHSGITKTRQTPR